MNNNLLQKILIELEYGLQHQYRHGNSELIQQIKQELNKQDLTEVGVFEITKGSYGPLNLKNGKYKLLAQKINE